MKKSKPNLSEGVCETCSGFFLKDFEWKTICKPCYAKKMQNNKYIEQIKQLKSEVLSLKHSLAHATSSGKNKIPKDMIKRLLMLVHPDKHSNSEASNKAFIYIKENFNGE